MRSTTTRFARGSRCAWLMEIGLYIITGPKWKDCQLLVDCRGGEQFLQMTLEFRDDFATYGGRRDPWTQKEGEDAGIGDFLTHGSLLHHGKAHLVTARGTGIIVRELNFNHMVNYADQCLRNSHLAFWFHQDKNKSFTDKIRGAGGSSTHEAVIPIPTYIGVTPWSYDETTWHDFVADTSNWLVYAGNSPAYKSMSFTIGARSCINLLNRWRQKSVFSPMPRLDVALTTPVLRYAIKRPHMRTGLIKHLLAY